MKSILVVALGCVCSAVAFAQSDHFLSAGQYVALPDAEILNSSSLCNVNMVGSDAIGDDLGSSSQTGTVLLLLGVGFLGYEAFGGMFSDSSHSVPARSPSPGGSGGTGSGGTGSGGTGSGGTGSGGTGSGGSGSGGAGSGGSGSGNSGSGGTGSGSTGGPVSVGTPSGTVGGTTGSTKTGQVGAGGGLSNGGTSGGGSTGGSGSTGGTTSGSTGGTTGGGGTSSVPGPAAAAVFILGLGRRRKRQS